LSKLSLSCNAGDFTSILQLQDVPAIGELHELRTLKLFQVGVTDLTFMQGLPKLTDFYIAFTPISDIRGIENATALTSVQLPRTNVVDVSPLLRLPNLTDVHVEYTPARSDVLSELERRGIKVHR
jgi:Leucine-rich repeat (LRR) protein